MSTSFGATYLASCRQRLTEQKALGDETLARLTGEELNRSPNSASNSIAVIVRHLHGNMRSRWTNFLTEDGEKPWRERDAEFDEQRLAKADVLRLWKEGWEVLLTTLAGLTEADLGKTVHIRSQPLPVVDAINRQLAHYSYHVGQVVYLGRWMKGESWTSLSIPKGGSAAYNQQLNHQHAEQNTGNP